MKRLMLALALLIAPAANASPELAETWGAKASMLYQDTAEMLDTLQAGYAMSTPTAYEDGLVQFAVTASRLGQWIDQGEGPSDLGCIFRGMAEEAEIQLEALETADDFSTRRDALKRLVVLLDDAQAIAVASAHSMRTGSMRDTNMAGSCPASAVVMHAALAE